MTKYTKIKEWYLENYSSDEEGEFLNEDVTFYDMFQCLDRRKDIYECIDVDDSLIRERLFEGLAQVMECDYSYIYDQWLQQ